MDSKHPKHQCIYEARDCFMNGIGYEHGDTVIEASMHFTIYHYYGHEIAHRYNDGTIHIYLPRLNDIAFRRRLNAIPNVHTYCSNGKYYLNGKLWDGCWVQIGVPFIELNIGTQQENK